jgi:hypothetical protein
MDPLGPIGPGECSGINVSRPLTCAHGIALGPLAYYATGFVGKILGCTHSYFPCPEGCQRVSSATRAWGPGRLRSVVGNCAGD